MQYNEMNYTEKRQFEATLTIGQRAKMRRMEKEFAEQIQPINRASVERENQVRAEAYKSLRIAERIQELEKAHSPRIFELREQFKAIQEELNAANEELSEARSKIQTEPYHAASQDPEVKAIDTIWRNIKKMQAEKFQKLVDSFAKVDA
jgi:cytochrome c556